MATASNQRRKAKPFTWSDCGANWHCAKCGHMTKDKGPRSPKRVYYGCPEHGLSFMLRDPWVKKRGADE